MEGVVTAPWSTLTLTGCDSCPTPLRFLLNLCIIRELSNFHRRSLNLSASPLPRSPSFFLYRISDVACIIHIYTTAERNSSSFSSFKLYPLTPNESRNVFMDFSVVTSSLESCIRNEPEFFTLNGSTSHRYRINEENQKFKRVKTGWSWSNE